MQSWTEYLAFLTWEYKNITLIDFQNIFQNKKNIRSVEQFISLLSHPEIKHDLLHKKQWWKQIEQIKKECTLSNIKTTWPFHPDYPYDFFKLKKPPLLISYKGEPCWKNNFLFSIVGSRKPYQDTLLWMDINLTAFLKKQNKNICIISGGARGIDQKAHALAISSQKATLCFLPCGIQNYYPADLKRWEKHILNGGGALISVFPKSEPMRKQHFHTRNQVLAYLSHLILIIQAQLRSGTMVTANYALNAGTTISVLPGNPLYPGYKGNLNLINDGCFMVQDYLDLETLYQSINLSIPQSQQLYKDALKKYI